MYRVDFTSREPVYEQIKNQIIDYILSGLLRPHDQLPSVRQMAISLSVNPNTVQKAYEQLEMSGIIYSLQGRGNFISENNNLYDEYKKSIKKELETCVLKAKNKNLSKKEIMEIFNTIIDKLEE